MKGIMRTGLFLISMVWIAIAQIAIAQDEKRLMLVGGVLPLNNGLVWRNLVDLTNPLKDKHLVIATAHDRPNLYGKFQLRAYKRYGLDAWLIPLAERFDEFSTDYTLLSEDAELAQNLRNASSIFFVGGSTHRLSHVLIGDDDEFSAFANAIRDAYNEDSLIIGGIPGSQYFSTNLDPISALKRGKIDKDEIFSGLDLLNNNWYLDQGFFVQGRFAAAMVAMQQWDMAFGIGVDYDTAAAIVDGRVDVIGEKGAVIIDHTDATMERSRKGVSIHGIRLSYLEHGDSFQMDSRKVMPSDEKLEEFEIEVTQPTEQSSESAARSNNVFAPGEFVGLMIEAVDSEAGEAFGFVNSKAAPLGFDFRFYVDEQTKGWQSTLGDKESYTLINVRLDIEPGGR